MFSAGNSASASGRGIVSASAGDTSDYKVILPRLPTGNLILNSVFLHADISGRPYRAPDMRDAIKEVVNLDDVLSIGQFQMSHVWMATCANAATRETLCRRGELTIKDKRCIVVDPNVRDIKM